MLSTAKMPEQEKSKEEKVLLLVANHYLRTEMTSSSKRVTNYLVIVQNLKSWELAAQYVEFEERGCVYDMEQHGLTILTGKDTPVYEKCRK